MVKKRFVFENVLEVLRSHVRALMTGIRVAIEAVSGLPTSGRCIYQPVIQLVHARSFSGQQNPALHDVLC